MSLDFADGLRTERHDAARCAGDIVTVDARDLSGRHLGLLLSVWWSGAEHVGRLYALHHYQPHDGSIPRVLINLTTGSLLVDADTPVEAPDVTL